MMLIIARLTVVLAVEGFVRCPVLKKEGEVQPEARFPRWRQAWFAAPDRGSPGVTLTIEAYLRRDNAGSVGLSGRALLVSSSVAEIRATLPPEALETSAKSLSPACVEAVSFGRFSNPRDVGSATIWITIESDVDWCVDQFMTSVSGPVAQWFQQRSSSTDLLALASTPLYLNPDTVNPDPVRLRGVVILALLEGRVREAVSLMEWYQGREQFHSWDSADRAAAFEVAIAERFTDYAAALRR